MALVFIKPQDLPEIARFVGRTYYKAKTLWQELKKQFKEMEKDLGIEDLKNEMHVAIAQEKAKSEDEVVTIVDMYGNEHRVGDLTKIRSDLTADQLKNEVEKHNLQNSKSGSDVADKGAAAN